MPTSSSQQAQQSDQANVDIPGQASLQLYFDRVQLHRKLMTTAVDKELADWRCGKVSTSSASDAKDPKSDNSSGVDSSGLTAGGCAKRSPPNSYNTLPTEFECRDFLKHLEDSADQLASALGDSGLSRDVKSKPQPKPTNQSLTPRIVMDRLSLLESLAELHEADELARRLYRIHAGYARQNRRGRDLWIVGCRHSLHLAWRGRLEELAKLRADFEPLRAQCAPGVGAATGGKTSGSSSASSSNWYPDELILADLAEAVCGAYAAGGEPRHFADASVRLRMVVRRYRADFAGKTRDLMLARAVLLLWQIRCRLLAGPELDGEEDAVWGDDPASSSAADAGSAEPAGGGSVDPMEQLMYLRRLTVSLVVHHFKEKTPCQMPVRLADHFARDAWHSVHLLLLCRHQLAWLFTYAGAVRESSAYLRECMLAAQSLCLPNMAARCLLLYAHLDAGCDNQAGAAIRLMQVDFIRTHNRIRQHLIMADNETATAAASAQNNKPDPSNDNEDDEEDNFLVAGRLGGRAAVGDDNNDSLDNGDIDKSPLATARSAAVKAGKQSTDSAGWDLLGEAAKEFNWLRCAMEACQLDANQNLFPAMLPVTNANATAASHSTLEASLSNLSLDRSSPSSSTAASAGMPPPPPPPPPRKRGTSKQPAVVEAEEERRAIGKINKMFTLRQKRMATATAAAAQAQHQQPTKSRRPAFAAAAAASATIESAPQADFVPQNILRRMEECGSSVAAAGIGHRQLRKPQLQDQELDEALVASTVARLESAYRLLRWLPPPRLFRPLCQQLALTSLRAGRLWEAAHYLCRCLHISAGHLDRANLRLRDASQILNRVQACESGPAGLRTAIDCLPSSWTVLQISYMDSVPGLEPFLLALRLAPGSPEPVICSLRGLGLDFLEEWQSLMRLNTASMRTSDQPQTWWRRRYRLDERAAELTAELKSRWMSSAAASLMDWDSPGEAVLLLDLKLHEFPWEAALSRTVRFSRMPSLSALVGSVAQVRSELSLQRSYYVLNPDCSLPATEATFAPIFADLGWDGVVSRPPEESELLAALRSRDLYVYCGHGSGSRYLSNQSVQQASVRAAAFLIGCSSGRLHQEGRFEPIGTVHSYIMGGCPAVLAILWDVTDKDIDRFFNRLLSVWRGAGETTASGGQLPGLVNDARDACKLKYLIGSAPVLFGLPSFPELAGN